MGTLSRARRASHLLVKKQEGNGFPRAFQSLPLLATARHAAATVLFGHMISKTSAIKLSGKTQAYTRKETSLGFHFCPPCACITEWRGLEVDERGRRRIAVNLRLADLANMRWLVPASDYLIPSPRQIILQVADVDSFSDRLTDGVYVGLEAKWRCPDLIVMIPY
jgi:hypothetical protein